MAINKKTILLGLAVFCSLSLSAKTTGVSNQFYHFFYKYIIFILAGIVISGALLTLFSLMWDLIMSQKKDILGEVEVKVDEAPSIPWYKAIYDKAWSLVPMEKEQDLLLHHDFDGIRELDNKLPPWWVYTFILTIIWGAVYFYMFQYSDNAQTQEQEYFAEMQSALIQKRAYAAKQANSVDEYNVVFLTDASSIESGEGLYKTNCSACHGMKGEGLVGPNLTDAYWLHGGSAKDIFKSIKYGIPEKGMISWKTQMSPSSMQQLTSYIHTLAGTDPPKAKARQGLLYEESIEDNVEVLVDDKIQEKDLK